MSFEKKKKIRSLSLWFSILLIGLQLFSTSSLRLSLSMSLGQSFPLYACFTYQFFHANIFHCLCNVWALLTITFLWTPRLSEMILAYIVSVLYAYIVWLFPYYEYGTYSIVGFSAPLYAFMGIRAFSASETYLMLRYNTSVLVSIALFSLFGLAIDSTSAMSWHPHFLCYVIGCNFALLYKPIIIIKS